MNEQALQDAYTLFQQEGYNNSFDDFVNLLNSNDEALQDAYNLFTQTGYNKSLDEFSTLMGVKKKDDTSVLGVQQEEVSTESTSATAPPPAAAARGRCQAAGLACGSRRSRGGAPGGPGALEKDSAVRRGSVPRRGLGVARGAAGFAGPGLGVARQAQATVRPGGRQAREGAGRPVAGQAAGQLGVHKAGGLSMGGRGHRPATADGPAH